MELSQHWGSAGEHVDEILLQLSFAFAKLLFNETGVIIHSDFEIVGQKVNI